MRDVCKEDGIYDVSFAFLPATTERIYVVKQKPLVNLSPYLKTAQASLNLISPDRYERSLEHVLFSYRLPVIWFNGGYRNARIDVQSDYGRTHGRGSRPQPTTSIRGITTYAAFRTAFLRLAFDVKSRRLTNRSLDHRKSIGSLHRQFRHASTFK